MAIPFPHAAGPCLHKGRRQKRWKTRRRAEGVVNLIVGWGNYVVLGCPKVSAKFLPPAYRGAPLSKAAPAVFTLTEAQRALASRLVSEVSPLLRLSLAPDATAGRGSGAFLQALAEMERLSYGVERGTDLRERNR